ncbi:MAG: dockerin type I repeat-containing protein [Candidatus Cloacimonetes bacterium]|nr:dockerin type I repeat-containing protein [Candidatus Cloacimonadota bacterium]
MPWSAQLDNYYNNFGNGYVPYFSVIGADYEYLSGGNNVSTAISAANNAMLGMVNISVVNPISNVILEANSSTTIDISDTFMHSQGVAMTYSITANTNPDCCSASISGTTIYLDALVAGGFSNITVTACAGNLSADDTFLVTVLDIYPAPLNPEGIVIYPEVSLSWEEPQALALITGWNIYRNNELIASLSDTQLSYNDLPEDGSYIYTIRTQYLLVESSPSIPIDIEIWNTIGDVDASQEIDSYDASMILHYVAGIEPGGLPFPWVEWRIERADIDGNGLIEAYDCALLLQYIVGIIDEL